MMQSLALHTALSHLDKRNTYVRMLFIDNSYVFNIKLNQMYLYSPSYISGYLKVLYRNPA